MAAVKLADQQVQGKIVAADNPQDRTQRRLLRLSTPLVPSRAQLAPAGQLQRQSSLDLLLGVSEAEGLHHGATQEIAKPILPEGYQPPQRLASDEGASTMGRGNHSGALQLQVGPGNGIDVELQLGRQNPHRREPCTGPQLSRCDLVPYLIDDLPVEGIGG